MRIRTLALAGFAFLGGSGLLLACVSLDGTSGGGGGDASDGGDAAPDGSDDAGELPDSTPGLVTCGLKQCSLPGTQCCIAPPSTPGGAISATCQPSTDTCAHFSVTCDERADCQNAEYCCIGLGDGGENRTSCGRTCATLQACRTDAECLDGKTCMHQTCFGLRLWVCAPNAFCSVN